MPRFAYPPISATGVTPGSYTYTSLTVDAYGRLTAASNGTAPITDHGALSGLTDDDHSTIYVYLSPGSDARNVIQPSAADVKALVLKGAGSQSDNLLEFQNSSGTRLSAFSSGGALNVVPDANAFGAGTYSCLTIGDLVSGEPDGALFAIARYNPANVPFVGFTGWDSGGARILAFGGGGWNVPDATRLNFYIAPSYSETTNTGVLQITLDGGNKCMVHKSLEILWDDSGTPGSTTRSSLALYQEYASTTGALIIDNYNADPAVDAITNQLILGHWTGAGTVTTGFGARQRFRLQSSTGSSRDAGGLAWSWTDGTDATRTSKATLSAYYTSTEQVGLTVQAHSSGTPYVQTGGRVIIPNNIPYNALTTGGLEVNVAYIDTGNVLHLVPSVGNINGFTWGSSGYGNIQGNGYAQTIIGYGSLTGADQGAKLTVYFNNSTAANSSAKFYRECNFTNTAAYTLMLQARTGSASTRAAGFGTGIRFEIEPSVNFTYRQAGLITCTWGVVTDATREGILSLYATDYGGDRLGLQITGNGSATEVGLYGTTPTIQYATTGTTTGFTAGVGTAVNDDSTFTGNTGATAYTISDIVRALKLLGAIAS